MAQARGHAWNLAWRKILRKTRAVMFSRWPTRSDFLLDLGSSSSPSTVPLGEAAGRRAQKGLRRMCFVGWSVLVCALVACGDDGEPAPQTTPTGSVEVLDASVRDLPGDGTDPTPEADIDARQRPRVGPGGLVEVVDRILNDGGTSGQSALDAGASTGVPGDAGTD
jgi:hypothetical protein